MTQHLPGFRDRPSVGPRDDERVVSAVLNGDREAFAILVRRHQEVLFRFACAMVGTPDAAADIVQESFVKAYTSLDRCRDPARFGAWIHRIVRNRCLDHLKRHRRQERLHASNPDLILPPEADQALDRGDLRAVLMEALEALPDAQREAFLMKHLEERSYEEMAELLDASVSALKMRVKRAREAMMSALNRATGVTTPSR